jgi:hypothetical protein
MNRVVGILIDITLVLAGIILTPLAILKWSEVGFRIEPSFNAGNQEGNSLFAASLLGIAMVLYGVLNLSIIRRRNIETGKNAENGDGSPQ